MRRRQFLGSLAAASAVGTVATLNACSGKSDTSSNGTVNLTFRQFDPPTEIAGLKKVVKAWNDTHPKIQVKLETLAGSADYAQQFAREANSGSGPDIVHLGYVNVKDLAKPKILLPVSELAEKSAPDTPIDQFLALDMNRFDDKVWALPWTVDTFAMAYNKKTMDKAGLKPPTSWPELLSTATKLGKSGTVGFAFAGASNPDAGQWFAINYYLWSNGISLISNESGNWAPGATAEQFSSAMKFFNSFFTSGATPKSMVSVDSINDPQIVAGLADGTTAMTMMAPQTVRQARDTSTEVVTAVMPDGLTDGSTHLGGRSLGINAATDHPDEAWEFVKYLNTAKAFADIPQYPAATTVLDKVDAPDGEEGFQKQLPHSRSFARYIDGPVPVDTLQKLSCAAFGAVYSGQKTANQSAAELVDSIAAAIKG
jgi:multiple sugar transport system substrate-binding protein